MNIEDTKKAIKVMQAFVDGKTVKNKDACEFSISGRYMPFWDWDNSKDSYSVKPQQIEIWCMVNSQGHCLGNHPTEDDIIELIEKLNCKNRNDFTDYKAVKFRQVIDE